METIEYFFERGRFLVQNGNQTRFWEDWWLGQKPLMQQYPSLCNIVRKKNQAIAIVLSTTPQNVSFRRDLVGVKLRLWHELVSKILNVVLTDANDSFKWNLM